MKNKNLYIFLGIVLLTSLIISPKIIEGLAERNKSKKKCKKYCKKKNKKASWKESRRFEEKACICKDKAPSGGGGGSAKKASNAKKTEREKAGDSRISFICTALYRNKHVSKTDYRLMTLFGILAVKTKKYEKDMMLYFTCMKHLMPYVEKKEKENKQFWNNLKIFFVSCIKNLKEEKYDNVIKLFTVKSISMAEKYCGGLKNIPKLSNKNYNLYKGIYKKNKERYNISAKTFLKLI